jgi:hypothetical protein
VVATVAWVGCEGSMIGCKGNMVGCDGCEGTWSVAMVAKEHGWLCQFQKWHWLVARMEFSVATIKLFVSNGCDRVSL